ncbi:MAG: hypothetical protein ACM3JG_04230 [Thiohalocapsa sp.]
MREQFALRDGSAPQRHNLHGGNPSRPIKFNVKAGLCSPNVRDFLVNQSFPPRPDRPRLLIK